MPGIKAIVQFIRSIRIAESRPRPCEPAEHLRYIVP